MSNARRRDDAADFIRDCIAVAIIGGTVMVLFGCTAGFIAGLAFIFRRNIAAAFKGR
jgi:hypothetical protein